MTSGEQSLIGGLQDVVNLIGTQAAGIAKIRTEAAAMKAQGEIGLLNQKFLSWVDSPTFKPEDFASKFQEHQDMLSSYADNYEFAPARETVKGLAASSLPQLYAQGAAQMNKVELNKAAGDFAAGLQAVRENPLLTADEKKAQLDELYRTKAPNFMDATSLVTAQSADHENWKISKATELARSQGSLQQGLEYVYNPEGLKAAGVDLSSQDQAAVAQGLQAQLTVNSNQAIVDNSKYLLSIRDKFVNTKSEDARVDAMDISNQAKEQIKQTFRVQNDNSLYTAYLERINNTAKIPELKAIIIDLWTEGKTDEKKVGNANEQWITDPQEERRGELERRALAKIAQLTPKEEGKEDFSGRIDMMYAHYKAGKEIFDEKTGKYRTLSAGDVISFGFDWVAAHPETAKEFKTMWDDLSSYVPEVAKPYLDNLKKTIATSKQDLAEKAWYIDDFMNKLKQNPTPTADQLDKWLSGEQNAYTLKEFTVYKDKKYEDGQITTASDVGKTITSMSLQGKLDPIINIDAVTKKVSIAPGYDIPIHQWSASQAVDAKKDYGLDVTPELTEGGTNILTGKDGKRYMFTPDAKGDFQLIDLANPGTPLVNQTKASAAKKKAQSDADIKAAADELFKELPPQYDAYDGVMQVDTAGVAWNKEKDLKDPAKIRKRDQALLSIVQREMKAGLTKEQILNGSSAATIAAIKKVMGW
jgi:hypothetical protein